MKKSFLLLFIFTGSMQAQQSPENTFTFQQVIPRLESLAASIVNPNDVPEIFRTWQEQNCPLRTFAQDMKLQESDHETCYAALKKSNSELLNLRFLKNSRVTADEKLHFVYETLRQAIYTYQDTQLGKINPPYDIVKNILTRSKGIPNEELNVLLMDAERCYQIDTISLFLSYMHDQCERVTIFYDQWSDFPLHKSIVDGSIKKLIDNGLTIDSDAINLQGFEKGLAPLHLAAQYSRPLVVQFLLDHGADIESRDFYGQTPLSKTCRFERLEILQLLIKNGADVNSKDYKGCQPLHKACNREIVQLLIGNGADVNSEGHYGYTPLHSACEQNYISIAQLLIKNGANINSETCHGKTPLRYAYRNNNSEIAQLLIENGAETDVNSKDDIGGNTPLHSACEQNYIEIAQLLIKNGADINSKNRRGDTPLHLACCFNYIDIAQLLIENGADVNSKDMNGFTPLEFLDQASSRLEIEKFLADSRLEIEKFLAENKIRLEQWCPLR